MADIQITGTLGRDAEMRFTSTGGAVVNFSVADDLRRQKPNGEWETVSTTWWRVALWGKAGEQAAEWLLKGARVVVLGAVHERKYETNGEAKSSFDVKARTVALVPRTATSSPSRPVAEVDPWASSEVPF